MWWWFVRAAETSLKRSLGLPFLLLFLSICNQVWSCTFIVEFYSFPRLWKVGHHKSLTLMTSSYSLLSYFSTSWQLRKRNNIPWHYCHLRQNANPSERGDTVFEYDKLFLAGLLLSAVLTFCSPFTHFASCTHSGGAAAPPVGERVEVQWVSLTRPAVLERSRTAVVTEASSSDKSVPFHVQHLQSLYVHSQHTSVRHWKWLHTQTQALPLSHWVFCWPGNKRY